MKKIIALVLAGLMLTASLAGCSKTQEYNNPYSSISLETIKGALENADSYKDITIKQSEVDEQFDSTKESLLNKWAEDLATGTAIEEGDTLKIDYVGVLDGETEPFEGGSATDAELKIGSDKFIDGFEDGLVGKKIGDEGIVLDLTFPKDYKDEKKDPDGAKKFNGKKVKFTVSVKSGKGARYNDALIKKAFADNEDAYDKFTTVAEYEKATMEDIYSSLAFAEYRKLVKMVKYPMDLLQDEYNSTMENYAAAAANYGMTLEEFVKSYYCYYVMGSIYKNLEDLSKGVKSQAASTIKDQYLLRYIYLENKEAIDKLYETENDRIVGEFKHEYEQYAEAYGIDDTFEEAYQSEQLKDMVIRQLVYEFLVDFVTVEDDIEPTPTPTAQESATPSTAATSIPTDSKETDAATTPEETAE